LLRWGVGGGVVKRARVTRGKEKGGEERRREKGGGGKKWLKRTFQLQLYSIGKNLMGKQNQKSTPVERTSTLLPS